MVNKTRREPYKCSLLLFDASCQILDIYSEVSALFPDGVNVAFGMLRLNGRCVHFKNYPQQDSFHAVRSVQREGCLYSWHKVHACESITGR